MPDLLKKIKIAAYMSLGNDDSTENSRLNTIAEYIIGIAICLNVVLIVVESFRLDNDYGLFLTVLRTSFFLFFSLEYILRVWIADIVAHDSKHPIMSRIRYMLTYKAIVDLLALLPVLLGGTIIDFRIFRVMRLLRIAQFKSLKRYTNVLKDVIKLKGAQLLASLFIVLVFMLVSAVVIYDLESTLQPKVFKNVLSGLWWSISAITTIGYGDLYPITALGKILGSFISIFGVFLMAVPIGILTTGFFEVSKNSENHNRKTTQKK